MSAIAGHIVIGADASNASNEFTEAPPPLAPLYMSLDRQFYVWWKLKDRPPISQGYGVRVNKAIQGHLESPPFWAIITNDIISKLGFKACKHEPCLYYHDNCKGQEVYFLRQVDDFAISTMHPNVWHELLTR